MIVSLRPLKADPFNFFDQHGPDLIGSLEQVELLGASKSANQAERKRCGIQLFTTKHLSCSLTVLQAVFSTNSSFLNTRECK